ncbi:hypothetical protein TC41_2160 [Alicyclobacillus acidocaldarius subsp. acidocaldarius Tc-4-1]|uniref:Uncharacterized protein n=1 Tax=Alicyclobacillus acidocaldarius (strain Tc-4-1) TaxID=1048834 RepID=F8IFA0_ALIAT|nr:hypothetical protein TC41_2160 [Alicyclobacillus acidocaldarius subsp. acidocaldarius Tc-4-1]
MRSFHATFLLRAPLFQLREAPSREAAMASSVRSRGIVGKRPAEEMDHAAVAP